VGLIAIAALLEGKGILLPPSCGGRRWERPPRGKAAAPRPRRRL